MVLDESIHQKRLVLVFKMIFLLDIGDKPKYLDSKPSCSSLTLTNDLIHPRITFKTLEQTKKIQITK